MIPVDFLIIEGRIREELGNLARLYESLERKMLLHDSRQRRLKLQDEWLTRAVGSILHDFYSAIEKSFRVIARDLDGKVPGGPEWHRELLAQMVIAIPSVRPPVISAELADRLGELLGFRHVFRNVYGFHLAAEKIDLILGKLPQIYQDYQREMNEFFQAMHSALEATDEPPSDLAD